MVRHGVTRVNERLSNVLVCICTCVYLQQFTLFIALYHTREKKNVWLLRMRRVVQLFHAEVAETREKRMSKGERVILNFVKSRP